MSNRTMQAKSLKLRRQKRLFPRYMSADYVPTGKPPNQLVMNELKERARSLAFDDEYADYLVKRKQLETLYPHPGREAVQAHMRRIQETAPSLMCVTLANTVARKVQMFYNEKRDRFILFEDNKLHGYIRTSLVYLSRERCVRAFQSETVRWVDFSSVHPPSSSD